MDVSFALQALSVEALVRQADGLRPGVHAVPDEIKQERWNALMARQQKISSRRLKRKVGTRQQVIIDEVGPTVAKGRSKADAPEIDGMVILEGEAPLGEFVPVRIDGALTYDLSGHVAVKQPQVIKLEG